MCQKNSIKVLENEIELYDVKESVVLNFQDYIDELLILAHLLNYSVSVEVGGNFDAITFEKDEKTIEIFFQHVGIRRTSSLRQTSCYAICNSKTIKLNEIRKIM